MVLCPSTVTVAPEGREFISRATHTSETMVCGLTITATTVCCGVGANVLRAGTAAGLTERADTDAIPIRHTRKIMQIILMREILLKKYY
jgi:hypothetical protein